MKRIKFPTATVVFLAIWIILIPDLSTLLTLLAAVLHESGHIFVASALGIGIKRIVLLPLGAEITFERACSYREEVAVAGAGAGANILCAALCFCISGNKGSVFFASANLALAVVNLLPVRSLDGFCVLRSALLLGLPQEKADMICSAVSSVFLFSVWLSSVFLMLSGCSGVPLFFFCCAVFITGVREV